MTLFYNNHIYLDFKPLNIVFSISIVNFKKYLLILKNIKMI